MNNSIRCYWKFRLSIGKVHNFIQSSSSGSYCSCWAGKLKCCQLNCFHDADVANKTTETENPIQTLITCQEINFSSDNEVVRILAWYIFDFQTSLAFKSQFVALIESPATIESIFFSCAWQLHDDSSVPLSTMPMPLIKIKLNQTDCPPPASLIVRFESKWFVCPASKQWFFYYILLESSQKIRVGRSIVSAVVQLNLKGRVAM